MDDPWNWDVDRVVQELCSTNRSWQPSVDILDFPPAERLESSLRKQRVKGFTLLTYSHSALCSRLGFEFLGQQADLADAVGILRNNSERYRLYRKERKFSGFDTGDCEHHIKEGDGEKVSSPEVAPSAPTSSVLNEVNAVYPPESAAAAKRTSKRLRVTPILLTPNVDPKVGRRIPTEADVISRSRPGSEIITENGSTAGLDEPSLAAVYLGEDAVSRIELIDDTPSGNGRTHLCNFFEPRPVPYGRQLQVQRLFKRRLLPRQSSSVSRPTKSDVIPGADNPEHDELLPLYGDSDEEYDSDTWEEIEAERVERAGAESRPGLSDDEVQAVLDDAIQKFATYWKERKLAKLTDKANRLWVDARKFGLKRSIDKNRKDLDNCKARLTKYCGEITKQHWRNATELKETTSVLEQTVEDREYFSSVLDIINAPDEPLKSRMHVKRTRAVRPVGVKVITADEEILTSESEGEPDDFIVDDEPSRSGASHDDAPMDLDEDDGVQQQNEDSMELEWSNTIDLTHLEEDASTSSPKASSKSRKGHIVDLATSKKSGLRLNGSLGSKRGGMPTAQKSDPVIQERQPSMLIMSIDDLELTEQSVAKELAKLDGQYLSKVFTLVMSIRPGCEWLDVMHSSLVKLHNTSKNDLFAVYTLLRLFETYKDENYCPHPVGWYKKRTYEELMETIDEWKSYAAAKVVAYMDFLVRLSDRFDWDKSTEVQDTTSSTGKTSLKASLPKPTPAKRKRGDKLDRQQEAEDLRESDRARVMEQNHRRDVLRRKFQQIETSRGVNISDKDMIINESKADDQGFIFVHREIAPRIKDHQVGGVRFMWDQIVSSVTKQGCLLAHTMGLGKTMQIITLLVAISDAAGSSEPSISSQIPTHLKESKTLILCPPSVVDNWMDELLCWAPENHRLLEFFKVDQATPPPKRESNIVAWDERGGVLIIGYALFSDYMNAERLQRILSEGPNLVVADEAHLLKNPNSNVHLATANFKTHSRIALTGSPLANKVEEYHAMINWVAPNYLSNLRDFRADYANPIKRGLTADSSKSERRMALKMLKVLKEEVAPKVQRVTTTILKHDLPAKKEFVITVPLTEVQRAAYETFIRYHQDHQGTSAFATVDLLSVLCAHPAIFKRKLLSREADSTNASKMEILPPQLVSEAMTLLNRMKDVKDHSLSWKILILLLILEECKRIGDTVLLFSQSIPTLDYLESILRGKKISSQRLDGSTATGKRQGMVKDFNKGQADVFLISTKAGGVGLNMTGANRVIVFDAKFNPQHELQAVGRAYRIGQKKPVYVYRFVCGGTCEAKMLNMAIWKMQLASRVVDKKNPIPKAENFGTVLHMPKEPKQEDISAHKGEDGVLDLVIEKYGSGIRAVTMMDTFEEEELEDAVLTEEDRADADRLIAESEARRSGNPFTPIAPAQPKVPYNRVPGETQVTGAPPFDNATPQHDSLQPVQGVTTHRRGPTPYLQHPSLDLQSFENCEEMTAFHKKLIELFLKNAPNGPSDRNRRETVATAIKSAISSSHAHLPGADPMVKSRMLELLRTIIQNAECSPRFVEAMYVGLVRPNMLSRMSIDSIKVQREYWDSFTAEQWERDINLLISSERNFGHLQNAPRRMSTTRQNENSGLGQHKPQKLGDPQALETVMERGKAKRSSHAKDPRLPSWAVDAIAKQKRIIPPSTGASSTPSTSNSHLSSKSPFK
ncbi:P-loop containing nucleoside triphosphate hydrolase protein [Hypoxylon sp. FL0543]|nr:P-loop containing nucleoside triphosphate hydrolase protein [Hypoxylon sp. FL0543]